MPKVELLVDPECPNVEAAQRALSAALLRVGLPAVWSELRVGGRDLPAHARGHGSPSVFVDGVEISGAAPGHGNSCRVYAGEDGLSGVPRVEDIERALRGARPPRARSALAAAPALGLALLPKVACPACWPLYAGVLGSLGLGFLMQTTYLLPLVSLALLVALAALAIGARARRGFGPLAVGVLGAATVLPGKFLWGSDLATYGGVILIAVASLWNAWPRRRVSPCCEATASFP
ncbi:MAG TPA: hypothetical protein DEF51_47640 [Myxococcales bacterium]|nr:hypothetical protein [Myxococcales bacterium]